MLLLADKQFIPLDQNTGLSFYPAVFSSQAALWYTTLRDELHWRQDNIRIAGKTQALPRLQAWYGAKNYQYSGIQLPAQNFTPLLADILKQTEQLTGHRFNVVLANFYRNGQDSVGWHSDDEKELGVNPVVATVSLGASRRFSLKPKYEQKPPLHIDLPSGSLMVMEAGVQEAWQHAILKGKNVIDGRISLTFRYIY